jgi:hypothetical protein
MHRQRTNDPIVISTLTLLGINCGRNLSRLARGFVDSKCEF